MADARDPKTLSTKQLKSALAWVDSEEWHAPEAQQRYRARLVAEMETRPKLVLVKDEDD